MRAVIPAALLVLSLPACGGAPFSTSEPFGAELDAGVASDAPPPGQDAPASPDAPEARDAGTDAPASHDGGASGDGLAPLVVQSYCCSQQLTSDCATTLFVGACDWLGAGYGPTTCTDVGTPSQACTLGGGQGTVGACLICFASYVYSGSSCSPPGDAGLTAIQRTGTLNCPESSLACECPAGTACQDAGNGGAECL